MVKTWSIFLFLIGFSVFFSGCQDRKTNIMFHNLGIEGEEINSKILIIAPTNWNTNKIGEGVALSLNNRSEQPIQVSFQNGIKIYVWEQNNWIEVSDTLNQSRDLCLLEPISENRLNRDSIVVIPKITKMKKQLIRLVVIGTLYENGNPTDKKTASFIDMRLKP